MKAPTRVSRPNRFLLAFLVVSLVIAGFVSFYASAHPDGLEYVAETAGFLDTADNPATAGSPLADYGVRGVDDPRLSAGLSGVLGVVVTLLLAGGLAWLLKRRAGAGPSA